MACATFVRRFAIWTALLGSTVANAQTVSLTKIAGDGQCVVQAVGVSSPLIVLVRDANGNPVPNVKVTWTVNGTQLGIIDPAIPQGSTTPGTTDSKGQSTATFIAEIPPIGDSILQGTVTASYSGQSVTFNVTSVGEAIIGVPNVQAFATPLPTTILSGAAGQETGAVSVQFKITGGQQNGANVQNVAIALTNDNSAATSTVSCAGGNTQFSTSSNGIATCQLVFGGKVGQGSFSISAANLTSFDYRYQVVAGAPNTILFLNGNNSTGVPGQLITLTAELTDIGGNPLSGVAMTWTPVNPGTVTLSSATGTTDTTGRISTEVTLGNTSGPTPVKLSTADGKVSVNFNITVNVVVAGMTLVSGTGQSVLVNTPFPNPLVVQVNDAHNNPVTNAPVTFSLTSGSAVLGATNVNTAANGQASINVAAGANAGPVVITASTTAGNNVYSQTFNLTVTPPGPVCDANLANQDTFFNGASFAPNFIAPGGIALIYCQGIANGIQGVVTSNDFGFGPLPMQVQGVNVQFNPPSGPFAPIYYLANQNGKQWVAIQVPFGILGTNPSGTAVPVVVTANGEANVGGALMPQIMAGAPGFLEYVMSDGVSRAILVRADGSLIDVDTPGHMAKPGETLRAFVTGLIPPMTSTGQSEIATNAFAPVGTDLTITTPVIMGIGHVGLGNATSVIYAHDLIGVWEVEFVVPATGSKALTTINSRYSLPNNNVPLNIAVPDPTNNNVRIGNKKGSAIPIQ